MTQTQLTTEQQELAAWMQRWKDSLCPHHQGFAAEYSSWDTYDDWDFREYMDWWNHRQCESEWEDMMDYHYELVGDPWDDDYYEEPSEWDLYLEQQEAIQPEPYDLWDYQEEHLDDRKHRKIPYSPY